VTFNNNGTFTSTSQPSTGTGPITTDAGVWSLTVPTNPYPVGNAQGFLQVVDSQGVVILEGNILLITVDQMWMPSTITSVFPGVEIQVFLNKMTP
jgi:hypothetical protein